MTHADGNLDLETDPKMAWALANRGFFPVDVNRAPREALLRVPGLGTRSVGRILKSRRLRALRTDDLRRLRCPMKKVLPFVVTADGWTDAARRLDGERLPDEVKPASRQLLLFEAARTARTGEV